MSYDVTRGQTTYYYTPYQGQNDKQNYDGEISGRILKITLKKTKYILLYSVPSLPGTEKKKWEGDIFFFVYSLDSTAVWMQWCVRSMGCFFTTRLNTPRTDMSPTPTSRSRSFRTDRFLTCMILGHAAGWEP